MHDQCPYLQTRRRSRHTRLEAAIKSEFFVLPYLLFCNCLSSIKCLLQISLFKARYEGSKCLSIFDNRAGWTELSHRAEGFLILWSFNENICKTFISYGALLLHEYNISLCLLLNYFAIQVLTEENNMQITLWNHITEIWLSSHGIYLVLSLKR